MLAILTLPNPALDMSSTELKEFLEEGSCFSRSKLDGLPVLYLELSGELGS